jgi:predicted DNA-binding transcriptional regulator YafY
VTLRLEPRAAASLATWRPATQVTGPDADGWVTLEVGFEDEEQARFIALGCGPRAEVVAPTALRAAVAADLAAALRSSRETRRREA